MRRSRRNRIRTWLRNRWFPNLPKGKDCGHLRHEFEKRDEGILSCLHCEREKEQRNMRWAV